MTAGITGSIGWIYDGCWPVADWWSFQRGAIELWRRPNEPEMPLDRAIRVEGERIRNAIPQSDFDHPGGARRPAEGDEL